MPTLLDPWAEIVSYLLLRPIPKRLILAMLLFLFAGGLSPFFGGEGFFSFSSGLKGAMSFYSLSLMSQVGDSSTFCFTLGDFFNLGSILSTIEGEGISLTLSVLIKPPGLLLD